MAKASKGRTSKQGKAKKSSSTTEGVAAKDSFEFLRGLDLQDSHFETFKEALDKLFLMSLIDRIMPLGEELELSYREQLRELLKGDAMGRILETVDYDVARLDLPLLEANLDQTRQKWLANIAEAPLRNVH